VYREKEFLRYGLIFQNEKDELNYFYLSNSGNRKELGTYLDERQKIFSNSEISIYLDNPGIGQ
jgi:hypothetical protein